MATSGTYNFNLAADGIIEEAWELCGLDQKTISSQDLRTARRSLDLLLAEWTNRQVNLWTLDEQTVTLVDGQSEYTLDASTVDVLDAVVRNSSNIDYPLERIGIQEYLNRPNKTAESTRPTQYAILRGTSTPTLILWPTPDAGSGTLVFYRMRYIQDIGDYTNTVDIPKRFLPSLVTGLAYKIALKKPPQFVRTEDGGRQLVQGVEPTHRAQLKQDYIEQFAFAMDEDRERASFRVIPSGGRRRR